MVDKAKADRRFVASWWTRQRQTSGSWLVGVQGQGRQAARGQLLDKAKADRRFVASGGQGQGRQAVLGQWWTRPRQTGGSWSVGGQGFTDRWNQEKLVDKDQEDMRIHGKLVYKA